MFLLILEAKQVEDVYTVPVNPVNDIFSSKQEVNLMLFSQFAIKPALVAKTKGDYFFRKTCKT